VLENAKKQMFHGTLRIQKQFPGLQSPHRYHELKKGAMILQSCNALSFFFLFQYIPKS
jgi:myosin V